MQILFLSPTYNEISKYDNKNHNPTLKSNPNANLLSTIIKIPLNNNKYILFTYDAVQEPFRRFRSNSFKQFEDELILAQVPHHGSNGSYYKNFWKNLNRKQNCPIVLSVGDNSHKLPSYKVLNSFAKLNYQIYATNLIGSLTNISEYYQTVDNLLDFALESNSNLTTQYKDSMLNGDQVFKIDSNYKQNFL